MTYFLDTASRDVKTLAPGVEAKTFWQAQMLVAIVTLAPGAIVPMHSHPHEQAGVVVEGTLTFTIDNEERILRAGDAYLIPGGVAHMAVAHDTGAVVMDAFSPVRDEYKY